MHGQECSRFRLGDGLDKGSSSSPHREPNNLTRPPRVEGTVWGLMPILSSVSDVQVQLV